MTADWKSILVTPDTPILNVIQIIDRSGFQIALVVDSARRLLGTVTDGDIRRGILKQIPLVDPVERIMFKTPTTGGLHHTREQLLGRMREKGLKHIPIVDDAGRPVGIQSLIELVEPEIRNNFVVLMAGGLGTRLRPLTESCPKSLLKVGGKPVLETIVENFVEFGFKKFYIAVNYKAEMIENYFGDGSRYNIQIAYLHEEKKLGTAGALSLIPQNTRAPIIVMNGDLLTRINFQHLLNFHSEHQATATMCVRDYQIQVPYGVVHADGHLLRTIDEKPIHNFFVNAGIYVLEPHVIDLIPPNTYYDMTALFQDIVTRHLRTVVFPIREYWLDIGRMKDLEQADIDFCDTFK